MAGLILLLFIAVPIAEIIIFIEAGNLIGLWATLLMVILTAIVGTSMLRQQGVSVLRRAEEALQRNELPMEEVVTGICLLVSGALLLTPGFLTDSIGFALLVPPFRHFLGALVFRHIRKKAVNCLIYHIVWIIDFKKGDSLQAGFQLVCPCCPVEWFLHLLTLQRASGDLIWRDLQPAYP